ncbi:MAG: ATP-dependent DNA helicase RecG [Treponema sp.]|nr:ATP-dependent DNA helicase RecG [Treponema sp.]
MFIRLLCESVNSIGAVKSSFVPKLAKLKINTIADLLHHYPRDWQDRRNKILLKDYLSAKVCTEVTVFAKEWIGYGKKKILKVYVEDESAQASLLFYNQPWMAKQISEDMKFMIFGKFFCKYGEIQSSSFEMETISPESGFGKIMPVYPLTSGIKNPMMCRFISGAIKKYADSIEDELPLEIIEKEKLLSKKDAIKEIHFPSSFDLLEKARKSLIYEELFYLEVMVAKRALERKRKNVNKPITCKNEGLNFSALQQRLMERLPFKLTEGQKTAITEINRDMDANIGMARLLQGDVGSGKTLVSFMAALKAVEPGEGSKRGQAAIMAPTELLARQHAENAGRLLEPVGIRIAFLTGNIKTAGRRELLKNLAQGNIDIVVGTHALFSKDVIYKNLKLAVIDEQHRFGVTQRSFIMTKGESADLLMMSATPIPRTLALTVFGDMDVSVIKDMPPGRKKIITHLAREANEKKVYDFVRGQLEKGRQAYFVYPFIESEDEIKDAVSMAQRLSTEIFREYNVSLIHSKLTENEKKETMDNFRSGEIKILAATSVVEVGVDVPNATCMVIEHAQRFGLSALHQLRGRVGRGSEQSYCFLVYSDELTDEGKTRLKVMLENTDGFIIAEEDLKLRGPGQIAGTEQSGYLVLGIANPIRDMDTLEKARSDVFSILENDPDLLLENHRVIARVLEESPPFSNVDL